MYQPLALFAVGYSCAEAALNLASFNNSIA
jgi:hypothetical protein